MLNGTMAAVPSSPTGAMTISGYADPTAETRKRIDARIIGRLRPNNDAIGRAASAPIIVPISAEHTVRPNMALAAEDESPRGAMKLWSMAPTAPEMTAVQ